MGLVYWPLVWLTGNCFDTGLSNAVDFESGIVVPNYVDRQVGLAHKAYVARDSMLYQRGY
jgi:hypothetical protein